MTAGSLGLFQNLSWEINVVKCILPANRSETRGGRRRSLVILGTNPTSATSQELERNLAASTGFLVILL